MKGLILAGGYGTRLRPLTYSQQKQLIPVLNKPILFYAIEDLIEAGINKIGIITGPNREMIINAVKNYSFDADIEFIHQGEPKGIAHAIKVARNFLSDDDFVVYLGDNILKEGITSHLEHFLMNDFDASILLCEVPNPTQFGVAELNDNGTIKRLVEKPKIPPSNLALVGIYFFTPCIHEAIDNLKPSWRNEYEITDAIQWLIDHGKKVGWTKVEGWWKDTGRAEDIIDVNRLLLDEIKTEIKSKTDATIIGRVIIEEGCEIDENTIIKGPVIIGKNCEIKNSYIGPYTSIGHNCKIENSEIEDSLIMDNTKIINGKRIVESLIGRGVEIIHEDIRPKGQRLVVGDNSKLKI